MTVVRPLANGVIADFEVAAEMLRYFLRQVGGRYTRSRVVLCVPSGVTDVEKRAVEEAALEAGAREAYLIEEPVAAAIRAGLPVAEARGNMIVDIGGGTTEVAVVSLGGIVVSQSLRVAGDDMDEAIMRAISRDYHIVIGQPIWSEVRQPGTAKRAREVERVHHPRPVRLHDKAVVGVEQQVLRRERLTEVGQDPAHAPIVLALARGGPSSAALPRAAHKQVQTRRLKLARNPPPYRWPDDRDRVVQAHHEPHPRTPTPPAPIAPARSSLETFEFAGWRDSL